MATNEQVARFWDLISHAKTHLDHAGDKIKIQEFDEAVLVEQEVLHTDAEQAISSMHRRMEKICNAAAHDAEKEVLQHVVDQAGKTKTPTPKRMAN